MLMTSASPSVARPRRHHRSTSTSSFDDCGAFAPLPNVPRRARANTEADLTRPAPRPTPVSPRARKAAFVVGGSSEEDDDDCPLVREVNQRARLAKQAAADDEHFGDFSYDAEAHRAKAQRDETETEADLPTSSDAVPFPALSSSPERIQAPLPPLSIPEPNPTPVRSASSPLLSAPPPTGNASPNAPGLSSVSSTSSFNSGTSTPIYLKNGRPLKPSLKSRVNLSLSTSDVASMLAHAKSAPTTPRVHFPTRERLESVVLFDKRARPLEVASGDSPIASPRGFFGDDGDDMPPLAGLRIRPQSSFPFPAMSPRGSSANIQGLSAALMAKTKLKIAFARSASLQPNPHPNAHVHFAAVRLLATRLSGSILVKNVSYNKRVAVRYTFDNWETTSEVSGMWSSPNALTDLPKSDPKPFGDEETELDVARGILVPIPTGWDRFVFNVKLDDVAPYLSARPMLVAIKFEALGVGEWWDNCGGFNYRFEFDHVPRKEKKEEPKKEEPKIIGRPRSNTSPAPLSTAATLVDPPSASLLSAKLNEVAQEEVKAPTPQMPAFELNPPTPDAKTPTPESNTPTPTKTPVPERPALKLNFPSDKTVMPEDIMTPTPSDLGSDLGAEMAAPVGLGVPKLGLGLMREHKPLTPPDSASSSPREESAPLPSTQTKPFTQPALLPSPADSPADSPASAHRQSSPLPSPSAVEAPAHSTTNVKDQSYADFIAKYCFAGGSTHAPAPSGHTRSASASAAYGYGGYGSHDHNARTSSPAPNFGWGSNPHASWGNVGFNYGTSFSGGDY